MARRILAWLLGLALLITAMPHIATAAETTPAKKPAVGGSLNLYLGQEPDSFNPTLSATSYGSAIYGQVYSGLFEYNDKWEPQGHLAESWSTSTDGLTFTIKLRKGVKFHDGSDLTAEDVVFTYQSLMDPGYTGPRKSNVSSFKAISAPDPYTVKIQLKERHAAIFSSLSVGILSKRQFAGYAVKDFAKAPVSMKPVGSGPYRFVEYKKGSHVTLERNAYWFRSKDLGGAPFISTLTFKIIPNYNIASAAFADGQIDLMTLESREVTDKIRAANNQFQYDRNGWGYFTLNTKSQHLGDKRVRQALTYALDRRLMARKAYGPDASVPSGPIPQVSWAYDTSVKPLAHDSVKAMDLLEAAGYKLNAKGIYEKDGEPLKLRITYSPSNVTAVMVTYAAVYCALIGIQIEPVAKEWEEIQLDMAGGTFDIVYSGFTLSLDPDSLYALFHSSQVSAFNRGRYNNPEVDKLLEAGKRESDPKKRKEIYTKAQQMINDDAPVILMASQRYSDWVSKKVKGGVRNFPGSGASDIYRWWINEQ